MQARAGRWGVDCFVSLRFFRLSKNMLEVSVVVRSVSGYRHYR